MPIANERRVVTADDGSTITAVAAVGRHTADGLGIVLLFHGPRFLGWASAYETFSLNLRVRGNAVVVRYGVYRKNDGACCPSSVKPVVYRWKGTRIVASGEPPLPWGHRGPRAPRLDVSSPSSATWRRGSDRCGGGRRTGMTIRRPEGAAA